MADVAAVRLEIGFDGGLIMGALVSAASADELEQALAAGRRDGLTLEAEDGRYTIGLDKIAYVKRFGRESRLGFGTL
ncbi:MAG: hypothetical protein H0V84_11690 [Actinobacteria bacterium]|nr:hypothetical protein [Actinomycetota bacterium]